MEIGPVAGIRLAPRVIRPDATRPLKVEITSNVGDETYTPAVQRAGAGAEDDDTNSDDNGNQQDEEMENSGARRRINLFV